MFNFSKENKTLSFSCVFIIYIFFIFIFKGDSGGPLHVKGIYGQLEVIGMYIFNNNKLKFYFIFNFKFF